MIRTRDSIFDVAGTAFAWCYFEPVQVLLVMIVVGKSLSDCDSWVLGFLSSNERYRNLGLYF